MQVQPLPYKSRRWETLISVIIGVFILSLVVFAISSVLANNFTIESNYARNNKIHLLEINATNIVRGLDTSLLSEKQIFYIEKDTLNKQFVIHSWSTDVDLYGYINDAGENITNTGSFEGTLYLRTFFVDQYDTSLLLRNQVIKGTIRELLRRKKAGT